MNRGRNPPPKGQGAARAKQMGLLLDLSPDGGADDPGVNDEDLEAELLALMGGGGGGGRGGHKPGGKAPVGMDAIERMAALCMKDEDEDGEDEDGDLEDDADLLAELNEVLDDDEEPASRPVQTPDSAPRPAPSHAPGGLEARLQERLDMYRAAVSNATAAGEASKARRYERGLKTLQSLLAAARKGKPVDEGEIPPPVATGAKADPEPTGERGGAAPGRVETKPAVAPRPPLLQPPVQRSPAVTPDTPAVSPLTPVQSSAQHSKLKASVLTRQREYKLAALEAKQGGNTDLARQHLLIAKKLDSVMEALDRGELVNSSSLPPPPPPLPSPPPLGDVVVPPPVAPHATPVSAPPPAERPAPEAPLPAPRNLAEALQQRLDRYRSAAEAAKSKGDERKARMHQRIMKQYQDAIKAHKAGRPVNLAELPVPPGCPPLQGSESGEQNFLGVLETAVKLANQDADAEEEEEEEVTKGHPAAPKARVNATPPTATHAVTSAEKVKLGNKAQQQLDFLLRRKQQFMKAALRSKQMKDMQGAAQHLRNAKGLDSMITAARGGLPVDISKIPSVPVSQDDYSLSRSASLSPRLSQQYAQLMEFLKQQHEKCLSGSQQFTQVGAIAEAVRLERLADESMKSIELLKRSHAQGCPVPAYHTEERTFNSVKIFPNLTASDMELTIIKGINLPAPPGVSARDLDASVHFEFPFPSSEEAQKDKTGTVKGTNSPEFRAPFRLQVNRTHRGFKRVIQTKGIKFDIVHRGGLFKTDKVVGNAQLKLEALENQCEVREIIEVMDGRKATGGKLEVRVRIREPLGGVQLQPVTEKWMVVDPPPAAAPLPERQRERDPPKSQPRSDQGRNVRPSLSPPQYKLHSFSLLNYDRERLEGKIVDYKKNRRDPPPDLLDQHKEACRRLQWQKSYLERGSSAALADYENVLRKLVHGLGDSVKRFSAEGNRDAAKDALGRLKMVENEMDSLRRKRSA